MIQRVVVVRLRPDYRASAPLVAAHTREVLGTDPDVRAITVVLAADERTRREWDFAILLRFDDLAAVERYRTGDLHRKYADVYLRPMREAIRVWNFESAEGEG